MPETATEEANPLAHCLGVICILVYQIIGIVYLVQNYTPINECIHSHIWFYVLISLIMTLGNGVAGQSSKGQWANLACIWVTNTALSIWGGIAVMSPSCVTMRNNHLWQFALATFILQFIGGIAYSLAVCCTLCFCLQERQSYSEV